MSNNEKDNNYVGKGKKSKRVTFRGVSFASSQGAKYISLDSDGNPIYYMPGTYGGGYDEEKVPYFYPKPTRDQKALVFDEDGDLVDRDAQNKSYKIKDIEDSYIELVRIDMELAYGETSEFIKEQMSFYSEDSEIVLILKMGERYQVYSGSPPQSLFELNRGSNDIKDEDLLQLVIKTFDQELNLKQKNELIEKIVSSQLVVKNEDLKSSFKPGKNVAERYEEGEKELDQKDSQKIEKTPTYAFLDHYDYDVYYNDIEKYKNAIADLEAIFQNTQKWHDGMKLTFSTNEGVIDDELEKIVRILKSSDFVYDKKVLSLVKKGDSEEVVSQLKSQPIEKVFYALLDYYCNKDFHLGIQEKKRYQGFKRIESTYDDEVDVHADVVEIFQGEANLFKVFLGRYEKGNVPNIESDINARQKLFEEKLRLNRAEVDYPDLERLVSDSFFPGQECSSVEGKNSRIMARKAVPILDELFNVSDKTYNKWMACIYDIWGVKFSRGVNDFSEERFTRMQSAGMVYSPWEELDAPKQQVIRRARSQRHAIRSAIRGVKTKRLSSILKKDKDSDLDEDLFQFAWEYLFYVSFPDPSGRKKKVVLSLDQCKEIVGALKELDARDPIEFKNYADPKLIEYIAKLYNPDAYSIVWDCYDAAQTLMLSLEKKELIIRPSRNKGGFYVSYAKPDCLFLVEEFLQHCRKFDELSDSVQIAFSEGRMFLALLDQFSQIIEKNRKDRSDRVVGLKIVKSNLQAILNQGCFEQDDINLINENLEFLDSNYYLENGFEHVGLVRKCNAILGKMQNQGLIATCVEDGKRSLIVLKDGFDYNQVAAPDNGRLYRREQLQKVRRQLRTMNHKEKINERDAEVLKKCMVELKDKRYMEHGIEDKQLRRKCLYEIKKLKEGGIISGYVYDDVTGEREPIINVNQPRVLSKRSREGTKAVLVEPDATKKGQVSQEDELSSSGSSMPLSF